MSALTNIEWCDSTFNPWMGCTNVSPACDHCYAQVRMDKRLHVVKWGAGQPRVRTSPDNWKKPHIWNRKAFWSCPCGFRGDGPTSNGAIMLDGRPTCPRCMGVELERARRRVFSASLADWLDNEVEIRWLVDLLDLIRRTPNLDWLLLTKRIGNWRSRIEAARNSGHASVELMNWLHDWLNGQPPANVWIGITVIDQSEFDRDYLKLSKVPAAVRFLSIEPMLGSISFDAWPIYLPNGHALLDWVICGGESGPGARAMQRQWVRDLRDECEAADIPFLFKQWGEWAPNWLTDDAGNETPGSMWMDRMGKKIAGRLLDGVEWNGYPRVSA